MSVPGQWLNPRHPSKEVFEKDFSTLEARGLLVACPGCKGSLTLQRRSPAGKLAGWCKNCNRGVCA